MKGSTMTLASLLARKAVRAQWWAEGRRVYHVPLAELHGEARAYLASHPELLAEAAEIVRNNPQLRTLAEREERRRRRNQR